MVPCNGRCLGARISHSLAAHLAGVLGYFQIFRQIRDGFHQFGLCVMGVWFHAQDVRVTVSGESIACKLFGHPNPYADIKGRTHPWMFHRHFGMVAGVYHSCPRKWAWVHMAWGRFTLVRVPCVSVACVRVAGIQTAWLHPQPRVQIWIGIARVWPPRIRA